MTPTTRTADASARPVDVAELDGIVTGAVHLPGSAGYEELSTPWNLAVPSRPVAVVAVADTADVAATVRWAGEHGVRVAVRATGHGAVDELDDTLLIHTRGLDEVTVSPGGAARIGAGVRWREVVEAAAPHGLAPLAGSSPTVGVVGLLTGGGLGPLSRTFGVCSDRVTAFEVVTGDGAVRRAAPDAEAELFRALRGGKGAAGIVTAVELDLLRLPTVYGGALFFAGEDTEAVLRAWAAWCPTLPVEATTSIAVLRLPRMPGVPEPIAGRQTVAVRFAWTGDPAEGERLLEPIRSAGTVVLGGVDVMPGAAVGAIHADPEDPMPAHEGATMLRELPPAAVEALVAVAGPTSACAQTLVEVRQLGGRIADPPEHPDAFSGRDVAFTLSTIGIAAGPQTEATDADAERIAGAMAPWAMDRRLPNFEPSIDPEDVARTYDPETLERLDRVIADVDPEGVLSIGVLYRQAQDRATSR